MTYICPDIIQSITDFLPINDFLTARRVWRIQADNTSKHVSYMKDLVNRGMYMDPDIIDKIHIPEVAAIQPRPPIMKTIQRFETKENLSFMSFQPQIGNQFEIRTYQNHSASAIYSTQTHTIVDVIISYEVYYDSCVWNYKYAMYTKYTLLFSDRYEVSICIPFYKNYKKILYIDGKTCKEYFITMDYFGIKYTA
jgi:hypothetical protein